MPAVSFSYYEYLWLRNKGVDASSLFEGLPLSLQADISLSLYKDLIERVNSSLSLRLFVIYFFFQFVLQLFSLSSTTCSPLYIVTALLVHYFYINKPLLYLTHVEANQILSDHITERYRDTHSTIPGHFGFVFEENSVREITWLS